MITLHRMNGKVYVSNDGQPVEVRAVSFEQYMQATAKLEERYGKDVYNQMHEIVGDRRKFPRTIREPAIQQVQFNLGGGELAE